MSVAVRFVMRQSSWMAALLLTAGLVAGLPTLEQADAARPKPPKPPKSLIGSLTITRAGERIVPFGTGERGIHDDYYISLDGLELARQKWGRGPRATYIYAPVEGHGTLQGVTHSWAIDRWPPPASQECELHIHYIHHAEGSVAQIPDAVFHLVISGLTPSHSGWAGRLVLNAGPVSLLAETTNTCGPAPPPSTGEVTRSYEFPNSRLSRSGNGTFSLSGSKITEVPDVFGGVYTITDTLEGSFTAR